jgi:hypothetical protein
MLYFSWSVSTGPGAAVDFDLFGSGIAHPYRADLALALQVQQRGHRFFNRRGGILPVSLIKIDMIGPKTLEALFAFVLD